MRLKNFGIKIGRLVFYAKKMKKIVFLILFFLISFSFGWIVCVSQVYDFFNKKKEGVRGVYNEIYNIEVWPLKIGVDRGYFPSEKDNSPVLYRYSANIKGCNVIFYPDKWDEVMNVWDDVFGNEFKMYEYPYLPTEFFERNNYIESEIEKIRYPVEFHSNYSKKELNME